MSGALRQEFEQVRARAECLFSPPVVAQAVARVGRALQVDLADRDPLVLCVMTGGLRFCSDLLGHLDFALELDYVHVSRYRDRTEGGDLHWLRPPGERLRGREVLIVDDILDRGHTLKAVHQACLDAGAATLTTTVLVDKGLADCVSTVDHAALRAPDRYLFGEGMDYKGYGRNLRGIWAIADG